MAVGVVFGDRNIASYGRPEPSLGSKFNNSQFSPSKNCCGLDVASEKRKRQNHIQATPI